MVSSPIPRLARATVQHLVDRYPVVAITGPRQSGKTTLVREMFGDRPYVSLEDVDTLAFAEQDPRGFLARFPDGAVLDEAQRCPSLFSYLQTKVDDDGRMGLFVLTGSQQLGLMAKISQSLAGRIALVPLLPFTLAELQAVDRAPGRLDDLLFFGLYPPIYDRRLDATVWYSNYVSTYLERDVRQLVHVRDLSVFRLFLRLCAGRTGSLLNLSQLGNACGVSHNTVKSWISVLEASYIVHRLQPHFQNFNKRLVKTPKLYFYDPGLAVWLLGIEHPDQVETHPLRGELFETWVVSELLKSRLHAGLGSNLYFWNARGSLEIDVIADQGSRLVPMEIKSGMTVAKPMLRGLRRWLDLAGDTAGRPWLIYGGEERQQRSDVEIVPWTEIHEPAASLLPSGGAQRPTP